MAFFSSSKSGRSSGSQERESERPHQKWWRLTAKKEKVERLSLIAKAAGLSRAKLVDSMLDDILPGLEQSPVRNVAELRIRVLKRVA